MRCIEAQMIAIKPFIKNTPKLQPIAFIKKSIYNKYAKDGADYEQPALAHYDKS